MPFIGNKPAAVQTVDLKWDTGIKTANFTAVAGEGYFCNTTSGAFTVTLPANPNVGDTISIKDYAKTFDTNALTLGRNSSNIGGSAANATLETEGIAVTLVYSDSTKGWLVTNSGLQSEAPGPTYSADFLVIAGGASGGVANGSNPGAGGGGAGGYRASFNSETSGGGGSSESSLSLKTGTEYTITVGAGGAAVSHTGSLVDGNEGINSSISGSDITDITSIGGGGGGAPGNNGGSGGGATASGNQNGGSGTANQGFDGGDVPNSSSNRNAGAGGGGASAAGGDVNSGGTAGNGGAGGNGVASTITASSVTRAGGGGGAGGQGGSVGSGGSGGGGAGANDSTSPVAGTANTGSGGGGGNHNHSTKSSGAGGSGIVILRVPTANYSGTTTGSPGVSTSGSDTILTFTGDGSYTA